MTTITDETAPAGPVPAPTLSDARTRRLMGGVKDEMDAALAETQPAAALPQREHFTGAEWIILRDVLGHRIAQHSGETVDVAKARAIAEGLLGDELVTIPILNTRVAGYREALAAGKEQR